MFDNNPFDFNGNGNLDPAERAFRDEFLTGGFEDDEDDEDDDDWDDADLDDDEDDWD